jgi:NSS family neurotransmitter:Na+ symporter
MRNPRLFSLAFFLMRYIAPAGILVVFAVELWK